MGKLGWFMPKHNPQHPHHMKGAHRAEIKVPSTEMTCRAERFLLCLEQVIALNALPTTKFCLPTSFYFILPPILFKDKVMFHVQWIRLFLDLMNFVFLISWRKLQLESCLFFKFIFITVLSHWDFSHVKFRLLSWRKASCDSHATWLIVHAGFFSISIIHWTLTWTSGPSTCAQLLIHTIVHEGVWTPSESLHWKLTLGVKSLATLGNWTCASSVPVRLSTYWAASPSL